MSSPRRSPTATSTPSSSTSSRANASGSVSPGATLPPGNSQRPANSGGRRRCATRTVDSAMMAGATTIWFGIAVTVYGREMAVLTDEQVDAALPDLNGWERSAGALRRAVKVSAFLAGIDAVRRVAEHAEAQDHHPDIDIRWRTVTFSLVTHSEGGITDKDAAMAHAIDGLIGSHLTLAPCRFA